MNTKLLEIRDEATCILALAIQMQAKAFNAAEHMDSGEEAIAKDMERWKLEDWFLHYRSGYPVDGSSIMLMCLSDGKATNDPYEWPSRGMGIRTMGNAHDFIIDNWDALKDGDVVDVQVILGETKTSKLSERFLYA